MELINLMKQQINSGNDSWEQILSKNTALDKNALILRVKGKIKKVSNHRRIVELKYYDIKVDNIIINTIYKKK